MRSHYKPRTVQGWITSLTFLGLLALTQPPLVFVLGNRIEPWIFGLPFLYVYLLVLYAAMIGVLIWARKQDL